MKTRDLFKNCIIRHLEPIKEFQSLIVGDKIQIHAHNGFISQPEWRDRNILGKVLKICSRHLRVQFEEDGEEGRTVLNFSKKTGRLIGYVGAPEATEYQITHKIKSEKKIGV